MSGIMIGLIVWSILTAVLIVLVIYRATLINHEDDQLFLSAGENSMAREQAELLVRLNKIEPIIKAVGLVSAILLLALGGVWMYQSFQAPTML